MGKILNFGSINIDHVYSLDHIVTPGETVSTKKYEVFPGGKGLNQSIALSLAGGDVFHAGRIGPDGQWLAELLEEKGVDTRFVSRNGSHTGHAVIQIDSNGQNCILIHSGANGEITPAHVDEVLSHFDGGDILVLQNEISCLDLIIDKASAKKMRIALNPSPLDNSLVKIGFSGVKWLLLNEIEGCQLTQTNDPDEICDCLLEKYPDLGVVLTLGKQGVLYRDKSQRHTHGIYDVPVVDTTAAGDTFTGFFLSRVSGGDSIQEALRLASVASSIAVSRMGAAISIPDLNTARNAVLKLL